MTATTGRATDLITFTRGTLATVTDSDGKIKWAPHNLLLASEQFDASSWTKGNIVTTGSWANTLAAPNGTLTADLVRPSTASANHYVLSASLGSAATVTYAVYAYAGGYTKFGIRESGSTGAYASFDLTGSGSVLASASAGSVTMSNPQITPIGGGWFRASVTFAVPSGVGDQFGIWILPDSYTTGDPGGTNWSGDGTKGIYLWGASVTRSDLGGMQANASAYPYYNPSTPKNLLGYSEAFDVTTSGWSKTATTVIANAVTAPNGSLSADSITESTATSAHNVGQNVVVPAGKFTISVYAKAGAWNVFQISVGGAAIGRANFDLSNGTLGSYDAGLIVSITPSGDGWYRCSLTAVTAASSLSLAFSLVTSSTAARFESYAGDGVKSIYLWGAQLSDSASLDPYVPNFGAAPAAAAYYGPRLDYRNGSALGLLVEEARTNLITQSDFRNGIADAQVRGGPVTATSFPGVAGDTGLAFGYDAVTAPYAYKNNFASPSTQYTFSVLVVMDDGLAPSFGSAIASSNLNDFVLVIGGAIAAPTSYVVTQISGSLYRVSGTVTTPSTLGSNNTGITKYTTSSSRTFKTSGWQLEAGSFATSYIPTAAATVTRNSDVASVGVSQFPYSASEGTIVASVLSPNSQANNRRIWSLTDAANGTSNVIDVRNNTTNQSVLSIVGATSGIVSSTWPDTTFKIAAAWSAGDYALCVDGGTVSTGSSGTLPTGTETLRLGNFTTVQSRWLCGWIRQITYIPRRLSNSELQQRTV